MRICPQRQQAVRKMGRLMESKGVAEELVDECARVISACAGATARGQRDHVFKLNDQVRECTAFYCRAGTNELDIANVSAAAIPYKSLLACAAQVSIAVKEKSIGDGLGLRVWTGAFPLIMEMIE